MKNHQLTIYLFAAFLIAWGLEFVGIRSGKPLLVTLLTSLAMFAPLLGVWLSHKSLRSAVTGIHWKPVLKGHVRSLFAALWLPALFTAAGAALYFILFPSRFDPQAGAFTRQIPSSGSTGGLSARTLLWIQIITAFTAAPFINMFFAVGEEAGWRGYLTPQLQQRLGRRSGLILSGIIWGVWHFLLIILTGYEYGTGYPGFPFTGCLAMCLFTVVLGILLSHLYEKTGCIWYPALAHGALNAIAGASLYFMKTIPQHYLLGPTIAGLIAVIPAAIFAFIVLLKQEPHSN